MVSKHVLKCYGAIASWSSPACAGCFAKASNASTPGDKTSQQAKQKRWGRKLYLSTIDYGVTLH